MSSLTAPKKLARQGTSPIVVDVLTEAPSTVTQGTWAVATSADRIKNAYFSNDGTGATADSVDFLFYSAAGIYTLYVMAEDNTDCCKVNILIDDVLVETAHDLYAAGANYVNRITITAISLNPGQHTLTFTVNGKHASSSDYNLRLTGVSFVRTV